MSINTKHVRITRVVRSMTLEVHVTRFLRAGIILAIAGACSDTPPGGPCGDCEPPPASGLLVSDPVTAPVFAADRGAAPAFAITGGDRTAYVSLPPGTVPFGAVAEISRVGEVESATTVIVDGGFDPVPIASQAGDSLVVLVKGANGQVVFERRVVVIAARPPIIVRTQPPRKKTHVTLNGAMLVYFSEPVDGATITTSSIRLLRGTTPVAGSVRFLDATRLVVEFVPGAQLSPSTDYELRVTTGVRDLSGAALAAAQSISFTTGDALTGAPASMRLTPDSMLTLARGATYPLAATMRDAAGTVLSNQQVVWNSSDPGGLAVSASGLLTAQREGNYFVTGSAGALSRTLMVSVPVPAAAEVVVVADASVPTGSMITLQALVRDANGVGIANAPVTWTSSNTSIATVVSADSASYAQGRVTGVSPGTVTITATSGTASGTATITVTAPQPVASVLIDPPVASLLAGVATQLTAWHYDATGRVIIGRPTTWTSDNTSVAAVDANGRVTGINRGTAAIRATSEAASNAATITVTTIDLVTVSAGFRYSCGLTMEGKAHCWGANSYGQLGSAFGTLSPVPVIGNLTFSLLRAGKGHYSDDWHPHTCGLQADGKAFCWGANAYGQLGSGAFDYANSQPQAVAGGLSFTTISAGTWHTCAITSSGAAYCWGWLAGMGGATSSVPVAVAGGHVFTAISAGPGLTCGITNAAAAYCWVLSAAERQVPSAVPGGLAFRTISVGEAHTCGVTTAGAAFCWGANQSPAAVTGGLAFTDLSVGAFHTCGVTTGGSAYCWGDNYSGELGNGSTTSSVIPVPVSGGLIFAFVTAGDSHSCGVTTSGITYCWGGNGFGELGNGTVISRSVPAKIAGQP